MKKVISVSLLVCVLITSLILNVYADDLDLNEDDIVYTGVGALSDYEVPDYIENTSAGSEILPTSLDLSEDSAFPAIGDQCRYGSCAAWATTYYQFGYQVAKLEDWNAKEDSTKRFSPKYTYNILNKGEDFGSNIEDYYPLLKAHGAVRYDEFPPPQNRRGRSINQYRAWCVDTNALTNALTYRVSEYHNEVFCNNSLDTPITEPTSSYLYNLKSILNSEHVIVVKVCSGESMIEPYHNNIRKNKFWSFRYASNGDVACVSVNKYYDTIEGYHAMCIVGYDDSIWYDYNGNGLQENYELGAFKLANSWSTDYGNDGYIWLMYDALNRKSNYTPLNNESNNRYEAILDYKYHYMDVEKYDCPLIAKVTINQTSRDEIQLHLGDNFDLTPNTYTRQLDTFLNESGGPYCIGGINNITSATFPFDFNYLAEKRVRSNYYVIVSDTGNKGVTYVSRIVLCDKNGYIVVDDSDSFIVDSMQEYTKRYKLGSLGDANNDGEIDEIDVTYINRALIRLNQLSDYDLITSDINQDGLVAIDDVTLLHRYIIGINCPYRVGAFVDLEDVVPSI